MSRYDTCPECGGQKRSSARRCRRCAPRPVRKPAACGTDSGYYRHLRGTKAQPKTEPCQPCRDAHAAAVSRQEKARAARRRAEREAAREKLRICPECGGRKSLRATYCQTCRKTKPYGRRVPCGTPSAYAYHVRHGEVADEACLEAHRLDVAARTRPRRYNPPAKHRCQDCPAMVSAQALRCPRCAARLRGRRARQKHAAATAIVWRRDRHGIWRAAS